MSHHAHHDHLGATALDDGSTRFLVWAPDAERVEVVLAEGERVEPLTATDRGYHEAVVSGVGPGDTYRLRLHRPDEEPVDRNDPASRWQPEGLHGPSAVDDPHHDFTDDGWVAPPLHEQVLYELHVGTFTPEGTFDAIVPRLGDLRELGVTAIELLPVWQFPGERNWGYDGVLPYAVQHSYGGPAGLRRLVDAAHAAGISVVLDVVYNHFGPEGNHLPEFGPYLTDRYDTPWGQAVNVDGPHSDAVRRYFVENAVRWVREFHVDGLRLDAVHAIPDQSAVHLLEELAREVHAEARRLGRSAFLVAESDLADPRLVRSPDLGGHGLDGQWLDDVHHALHVAFTGEQTGYYEDFDGLVDLQRALRDRYVMAGRYSPHRQRTVGRSGRDVPYFRFVACTQNHDQVGNRMLGERQSHLLEPGQLRASAGALLLAPFTPMLWMGQEYAETAPFQYFVSHTDPELVEAVRTGRRREFAYFADQGEAPDPQATETFERSRLDWSRRDADGHATVLALYRELLRLRRELPALTAPDADEATSTLHAAQTLSWRRGRASVPADDVMVVVHAGDDAVEVPLPPDAAWELVLDTAETRFDGPGGVVVRDGVLHLPGTATALLRRA
ncbi:malto-oligosyltrehalose trehalohydrolase [Egicoccus halophilus]|uniref:Malto-oligosyltrehalose trehalohydrolase n=1 Tax=Egicoccus halophilus TaxID=1670830 RepID=A0A8J3EUL8_9ACTN|nr:malto-oligosyltrehalose trehalohydrolase [Egicoccus halophilus]GGI07968.1 malto-oligosyltrehalose trehalohydrolase [Egicoccus halophilus]